MGESGAGVTDYGTTRRLPAGAATRRGFPLRSDDEQAAVAARLHHPSPLPPTADRSVHSTVVVAPERFAPDGIRLDLGGYVEVPDRPIEVMDVAAWQHPTKAIFARLGIELRRVVLTEQGTYPTFDVTMRALHDTPEDRAWIRSLYDELCVANFGWSFAIRESPRGRRGHRRSA